MERFTPMARVLVHISTTRSPSRNICLKARLRTHQLVPLLPDGHVPQQLGHHSAGALNNTKVSIDIKLVLSGPHQNDTLQLNYRTGNIPLQKVSPEMTPLTPLFFLLLPFPAPPTTLCPQTWSPLRLARPPAPGWTREGEPAGRAQGLE